MPFEGKNGPDTGISHSSQLANQEHAFKRVLDRYMHQLMVLSAELDRAEIRARKLAAESSPEEFDAEICEQENAAARVGASRRHG